MASECLDCVRCNTESRCPSVKRLQVSTWQGFALVEPDDNGAFVRYHDYEALKASHDDLLASVTALVDILVWKKDCLGVEFDVMTDPCKYLAQQEIIQSAIEAGKSTVIAIDELNSIICRAEKI